MALRWIDLDPATHAFALVRVRELIRASVVDAAQDVTDEARDALVERIDRTYIAELGAWAGGWRWAASEPGGGGPVNGWCCPRDSVLREDDADEPQATVERALAALRDWRAYLEQLRAAYEHLHAETREVPLELAVEYAAAELLPIVLDRTHAEDAWYATFAAALYWFVEPLVTDVEQMCRVVSETISGRFESWIAPDDQLARATCAAVGAAVAAIGAGEPRDAITEWLGVRGKLGAPGVRAREPVTADGHRRYIDGIERARDPVRADRMAAALELCRASATSGMQLSLGQLAEWQAIVLGESKPIEFRTGDAFGKRGRERYRLEGDTREQFERVLGDAGDPAAEVALRAARVYLDVCFFHPFADGNGRAARLALDHVLTAAGLALHAAEPVFVVSRASNDAHGATAFAYLIERMLGSVA